MREWPTSRLADVVVLDRRRVMPTDLDEEVVHYSIPALDDFGGPLSEPSASIKSHKFAIPYDACLLSLLNPRIPRMIVARGGPTTVGSTEFAVLRPRDGTQLMLEYLGLVLQSDAFLKSLQSLVSGTTGSRQRVKPKQLLELSIPVPVLEVQRRIVDLIERIDDAVVASEVELALARRAGRTLRADTLGQADVFVPLGEVADVRMGRQRSPQDHAGEHMIPYLRSANVKDNRLELDDVKEMNFTPDEQVTFELETGDVLVTEGSGSIAEVGASAAWDHEIPAPVAFQNTLIRLRTRDERVAEQRYLLELSRWAYESGLWLDIASGTNIKHIGSRRAATAQMPLLPSSEQQALCEQAAAVDAVVDAGERHHAALTRVRTQMLRVALTGELQLQESYDRFFANVDGEAA